MQKLGVELPFFNWNDTRQIFI